MGAGTLEATVNPEQRLPEVIAYCQICGLVGEHEHQDGKRTVRHCPDHRPTDHLR